MSLQVPQKATAAIRVHNAVVYKVTVGCLCEFHTKPKHLKRRTRTATELFSSV